MRLLSKIERGVLLAGAFVAGISYPNLLHHAFLPRESHLTEAYNLSVADGDGQESDLAVLNKALREESINGDFNIRGVEYVLPRGKNDAYTNLYFGGSWRRVAAVANPLTKRIVLRSGVSEETVVHEIKHHKHFAAMKKDSEFMDEWNRLVYDENGKSMYLSKLEQFCYYLPEKVPCVDYSDKMDLEENRRLGFPTNYARLNAYEHIAELASEVEVDHQKALELIKINPKYAGMLQLLEDSGIISEGLVDYERMFFDRHYDFSTRREEFPYVSSEEIRKANDDYFLDLSSEFIQEHPNSPLVLDLRERRGDLYYVRARDSREDRELNVALAE